MADVSALTYPSRLEEPSESVSSFAQLVARLEYAAFYHEPTITANLTYSYTSLDAEVHKAYWASTIMPCTMDLKLASQSGDSLTVAFTFYEEAKKHYDNSSRYYTHLAPISPAAMVTTATQRDSAFAAFPYKTRSKSLTVASTQQLVYALTKGYLPVPVTGTPAATALTSCEGILRKIVTDSMSDLGKLAAIYDYTSSHICYDFVGDDYAGPNSKSSAPNAFVAVDDGFFLEGALQGFAVCEGWTKLFTVLSQLENLPAYNVSGYSNTFNYTSSYLSLDSKKGWATHAYNYYTIAGTNYVIDASWSQSQYANNCCVVWTYFLVSPSWHVSVSEMKDNAIISSKATSDYDYFPQITYVFNNASVSSDISQYSDLEAAFQVAYDGATSGLYSSQNRRFSLTMGLSNGVYGSSSLDSWVASANTALQTARSTSSRFSLYSTPQRGRDYSTALFYFSA